MTTERGVVSAFRHTGIVVTDTERSLGFYRDLLGLSVVRELEESGAYLETLLTVPHARVRTIKLSIDGTTPCLELLQFPSHPATAPASRPVYAVGPSHVAFSVSDVEAVYRRLSKAGVSFTAPPQRSPDGAVKVTCCRDPDGVMVELVEVVTQPARSVARQRG